jgi:hypothetical protein
MSSNPQDLPAQVAAMIDRAWPCFVHYADPRELVGDAGQERIERLFAALRELKPTTECDLPGALPAGGEITKAMVQGHEHNPACITLAAALVRCIPALAQTVGEGRCPTFYGTDEWSVRAALAEIHHLHHRLDRTGEDDTPLLEALCTKPSDPRPAEIGTDWRYIVRLTGDGMGGDLSALDFMPMRCFVDHAQARVWSLMQAMWDSLIFTAPDQASLEDPRQAAVMLAIAAYDGTSDAHWELPSTGATIHLTARTSQPGVGQ